MDKGATNRPVKRTMQETSESNAKIIEEMLRRNDWNYLSKAYAIGFATVTASVGILLFVIVGSVLLATSLF